MPGSSGMRAGRKDRRYSMIQRRRVNRQRSQNRREDREGDRQEAETECETRAGAVTR